VSGLLEAVEALEREPEGSSAGTVLVDDNSAAWKSCQTCDFFDVDDGEVMSLYGAQETSSPGVKKALTYRRAFRQSL
jgi:hypothetical protein